MRQPWTAGRDPEFHDRTNPADPALPGNMLGQYFGWVTGGHVPFPTMGTRLVAGQAAPGRGQQDIDRFGIKEGINTLGGLSIGIRRNQFLAANQDVYHALYGQNSSLEDIRKAGEGSVRERQRAADLGPGGPLGPLQSRYAGDLLNRQNIERPIVRAGRAPYLDEAGRQDEYDRIERTYRQAAGLPVRAAAAGDTGRVNAAKKVVSAAEKEAEHRALIAEQKLADLAGTEGPFDRLAREKVLAQERRQQIGRREQAQAKLAGFGDFTEGSLTQRAQAWIASRQEGRQRSPLEFQTGGKLLASKAITTASFGLTGGLLYGGLSLGKQIFQEANQLQVEMAIIKTQFENMGVSADSISFAKFKDEIHSISVETGIQADQVAKVLRQLSGAFADADGLPDFKRAMVEGRTALEYSKISGLPQQEITDSLTAMSLAFADARNTPMPFEHILDGITDMENRFGVLGPEILKFAADLAPMADQMGLSFEQITGLGAVAQQRSGKSGAVLAEQLGRILPALSQNAAPLAEVLAQNDKTKGLSGKMYGAFKTGQSEEGLKLLVEAYQDLEKNQQEALILAVGGPRQAGTFAALLDNPDQTLAVLNEEGMGNAEGSHKKRWDEYSQTVTHAFEEMRRTVEEFGQKLFEAGIGDAMLTIAGGAKALLDVTEKLVGVFGLLNGLLGGVPAKAAGLYGLAKIMGVIWGGGAIAGRSFGGAGGFLGRLGSPFLGGSAAGTFGLRPGVSAALSGSGGLFGWRDRRAAFMQSNLLRATSGTGPAAWGSGLLATGAAGLPAMAATAVVAYGVGKFGEAKARREENEKKRNVMIAEDFAKGQTREDFVKKYKVGSDASPGEVGGRSTGEKVGALFTNLAGTAGALWSGGFSGGDQYAKDLGLSSGWDFGSQMWGDPDAAEAMRERRRLEAERRVAPGSAGLRALKDMPIAERRALVLGRDREALDGGVRDKFNEYFRTQKSGSRVAKEEKFSLSSERINKLITDARVDPKDEDLATLVQWLSTGDSGLTPTGATNSDGSAPAKAYFDERAAMDVNDAVNAQIDKIVEDQEPGGKAAKFDDAIKSYQDLLKAGDVGPKTLQQAMEAQIAYLRENVRGLAEAGGSAEDIAVAQGLVDTAEAGLVQMFSEVDAAGSALYLKMLALQGVPSRTRGLLGVAFQRRDLSKLLASGAATPVQLGAAFDNALAAQEAYIGAASSNSRTAAEGPSTEYTLTDAERRAGIATQLGTGQNANAMADLAAARGEVVDGKLIPKDVSQVTQGFAAEITAAGGLEAYKQEQRAKASQGFLFGVDMLDAGGYSDAEQARIRAEREVAQQNLAAANDVQIDDLINPLDIGVEKKVSNIGANIDLDKARAMRASGGKDSVLAAKFDLDKAREQLAATPEDAENFTERQTAYENALTAYNEAERARATNLRQAAVDLAKAQHYGDTGYAVEADLAAAYATRAEARTEEEIAAGDLGIKNAQNAKVQYNKDQVQKASKYRQTLLQGDSVAQAREALAAAQAALNSATPDEKYDAMSTLVEAQRKLQQSILDVFISQKDLAIAMADAAGDTVQVALLELQKAQENLRSAEEAGLKGDQLNAAKTGVVQAQANLTSVVRQDRLGDLEYMYEFDKITATAYIAQLKLELKKIPESNKEARRDIERRIKALRDEMSADLTFNIPSDVKLPTLYEARRLGSAEAMASGGSGSYQDNRVIEINVNGAQDPEAVTQAVVDAINEPPRSSSTSTFGLV